MHISVFIYLFCFILFAFWFTHEIVAPFHFCFFFSFLMKFQHDRFFRTGLFIFFFLGRVRKSLHFIFSIDKLQTRIQEDTELKQHLTINLPLINKSNISNLFHKISDEWKFLLRLIQRGQLVHPYFFIFHLRTFN